jgi:myo-inositol 2-dehydrogenase/D-chiro-inositol 1-dehydrogenase
MSGLAIGVLGSGRMARFRARALVGHPEVGRVAIGSRDHGRAEAAAAATGAQGAGSVEDLLGQELDAVVISSATADHPAQIAACLERGLPTLCEKPVATTLEESRELVERAERAGTPLQIAFQRRFDAGFAAARERIASGALGTIYSIRLASHDRDPPPEHFVPTSGGIFRDLHVHDFDLARWLADEEVESVFALGVNRSRFDYFERNGDVDTTAIVLRMESGLPVLVSGGRHDPLGHEVRAEVFGSDDTIAVGLDRRTPLRSVEAGMPGPPANPYAGFIDRFTQAFLDETAAFVDVVQGRRENPCPGSAAVEATRVALACERSHAEHRVLRVAEVEG